MSLDFAILSTIRYKKSQKNAKRYTNLIKYISERYRKTKVCSTLLPTLIKCYRESAIRIIKYIKLQENVCYYNISLQVHNKI